MPAPGAAPWAGLTRARGTGALNAAACGLPAGARRKRPRSGLDGVLPHGRGAVPKTRSRSGGGQQSVARTTAPNSGRRERAGSALGCVRIRAAARRNPAFLIWRAAARGPWRRSRPRGRPPGHFPLDCRVCGHLVRAPFAPCCGLRGAAPRLRRRRPPTPAGEAAAGRSATPSSPSPRPRRIFRRRGLDRAPRRTGTPAALRPRTGRRPL